MALNDSQHKVAILIPTKGRILFVLRLLKYYQSVECAHPLYIGDASEAKHASLIQAYISKLNISVHYFNWENIGPNQTIVMLAQEAFKNSVMYCAFHGDDDYFIPQSLFCASEFLSKNPTYTTCQGRAALFTLDRPGAYGNLASIDDYWGVNELDEDSPIERLKYFSDNYYVLQFSTHRSSEFIHSSEAYMNINNDSLGELMHCWTFAISGKSKFIDCLYLIRHSHPAATHLPVLDLLLKPTWSLDIENLKEALTNQLSRKAKISKDQALKIVMDILKKRILSSILSSNQNILRRIFISLKSILPRHIKYKVRVMQVSAGSLSILQSKKSIYYEQFKPVLDSMKSDV
jgi:glycosyltransferase domain-containing protein